MALVEGVDDAGAAAKTAGVEPGDRAAAARSAAALTSLTEDLSEDVRVGKAGRATDAEDDEEAVGFEDGSGGEGAAGVKAVNLSRRAVRGSESNDGDDDADAELTLYDGFVDHECERCDSVSLPDAVLELGELDAELLLLDPLADGAVPFGARLGVGGCTKMKLLVLATGSDECER